jgi:hypothetical protein
MRLGQFHVANFILVPKVGSLSVVFFCQSSTAERISVTQSNLSVQGFFDGCGVWRHILRQSCGSGGAGVAMGELAELEEGAGGGVLHGQGAFDAACASGTFAANHGVGL